MREMYRLQFPDQPHPRRAVDSAPYWRDVGTIDAYYEANMDLRYVSPALISTTGSGRCAPPAIPDPPAKFTFDEEDRRGQAIDSIVSGGCILSGGMVKHSVLGRGVRVHSGRGGRSCVIMDNCDIGRRAKVRRAILDKNVRVPEDTSRLRSRADRARGWHVTDSGIVVIGRQHSPVPMAAMFA